eukprot:scaffold527_cov368-Prasinococcus_capsulatus_cf.AAC.5
MGSLASTEHTVESHAAAVEASQLPVRNMIHAFVLIIVKPRATLVRLAVSMGDGPPDGPHAYCVVLGDRISVDDTTCHCPVVSQYLAESVKRQCS